MKSFFGKFKNPGGEGLYSKTCDNRGKGGNKDRRSFKKPKSGNPFKFNTYPIDTKSEIHLDLDMDFLDTSQMTNLRMVPAENHISSIHSEDYSRQFVRTIRIGSSATRISTHLILTFASFQMPPW